MLLYLLFDWFKLCLVFEFGFMHGCSQCLMFKHVQHSWPDLNSYWCVVWFMALVDLVHTSCCQPLIFASCFYILIHIAVYTNLIYFCWFNRLHLTCCHMVTLISLLNDIANMILCLSASLWAKLNDICSVIS